jgi:virulence factor Mce-like protein
MNLLGRRIMLGLVVIVLVTGALGVRSMLHTEPLRFTALFDSTIGLYPGSEVQVLGVPIGKVTAVDPAGDNVRVSMEIDPDHDVAADTGAVIIAPTMVSDRFVQLTKPWVEGRGEDKLQSGAKLGRDRTAVPVEIDDIYAGIGGLAKALGPKGANKNGALSRLLRVGARNLDGQGEKMNTMIRQFGEASATLSGIDRDFFGTLDNLDELNTMLLENDAAVGKVNQQFADVANYLAKDREEFGKAAANLGSAMAIVDDFIRKNREHLEHSVDNLVPTAKLLEKQRKSLEEAVELMPYALHNFLDAYDPKYNVLASRGNLNEVTIWSKNGLTARTSSNAPPTLVPGVGAGR